MNITAKDVAVFAFRALVQYTTIIAACSLMGGVISLLIAVLISLLAATLAGDWFDVSGYDMAVSGCARTVTFFRGFCADVAAKVQA